MEPSEELPAKKEKKSNNLFFTLAKVGVKDTINKRATKVTIIDRETILLCLKNKIADKKVIATHSNTAFFEPVVKMQNKIIGAKSKAQYFLSTIAEMNKNAYATKSLIPTSFSFPKKEPKRLKFKVTKFGIYFIKNETKNAIEASKIIRFAIFKLLIIEKEIYTIKKEATNNKGVFVYEKCLFPIAVDKRMQTANRNIHINSSLTVKLNFFLLKPI